MGMPVSMCEWGHGRRTNCQLQDKTDFYTENHNLSIFCLFVMLVEFDQRPFIAYLVLKI
jgi:hypothetical protein